MIAWNRVDLPTLARPTYLMISKNRSDSLGLRRVLLHTIPLFKLFPGRPKGIFFSSSFFLGGILLLNFVDEAEKCFEIVSLCEILGIWKSEVEFVE